MEVLECKYSGEMSVADIIFGRWEIAVANKAYMYIRNGSGSNIGAQAYNAYQYKNIWRFRLVITVFHYTIIHLYNT